MHCPECQRSMVIMGRHWICGFHDPPVFRPVETASAAPTSVDWLSQVETGYPFPIAVSCRRLREDISAHVEDRDALRQLIRLKDCVETTVKYLSLVALSARLARGNPADALDKQIRERLVWPSLGTWIQRILLPLVQSPEMRDDASMAPLAVLDGGSILNELREFTSLRNRVLGHGIVRDPREDRADLNAWVPRINRVLDELRFLADWPLAQVQSIERQNVVSWMGADADGDVVPLESQRDAAIEAATRNGEFLLLLPDGRAISLYPFISLLICPRCSDQNRLFLYDSQRRYTTARKQTEMIEYSGGHKSAFDEIGQALGERFDEELLLEYYRNHRRHFEVLEGKLAEFDFDTYRQRVRHFVGRKPLLEIIENFLSGQPTDTPPGSREFDRGYFLLIAEAGIGKTALLTHWIDNNDVCPVPIRFFWRRGRNLNAFDFHRHLYQGLLRKHNITDEDPPQNERDYPRKVDSLLKLVSGNYLTTGEREVIVIDGLDEAGDERARRDALQAIPRELPPNIYFLISSRPVRELDSLNREPDCFQYQLNSDVDWNKADVREYVELQLAGVLASGEMPADLLPSVNESADGNFLWAEQFCQAIRSGVLSPDSIGETLPRIQGLEQLYREFWDRALEGLSDEAEQRLWRVAGILAVARTALTGEQICRFAELDDTEFILVRRVLQQYLDELELENENDADSSVLAYRLYHTSFRDYVLNQTGLNPQQSHARISRTYLPETEGKVERADADYSDWDRYGLSFVPYHLIESRQHEALFGLVRDEAYIATIEESVSEEPRLPLAISRMALGCSTSTKNAGLIAQFLVILARRAARMAEQSPLDTLRAGNVQRTVGLADLHGWKERILWLLLVAWELGNEREEDEARAVIQRVYNLARSSDADLPASCLDGWMGNLAAWALVETVDVNPSIVDLLKTGVLAPACVARCADLLAKANPDLCVRIARCIKKDEKHLRTEPLFRAAQAQSKLGHSSAACRTLRLAALAARQLPFRSRISANDMLAQIAEVQEEFGDRNGAVMTLTARVSSLDLRGAPDSRNVLEGDATCREIALSQLRLGDVGAAVRTAAEISQESAKFAVELIAQAGLGTASHEIIDGILERIEHPIRARCEAMREEVRAALAAALAKDGEFQSAIQHVERIEDRFLKISAAVTIANSTKGQPECREAQNLALATFDQISDDDLFHRGLWRDSEEPRQSDSQARSTVLQEICLAQVKGGFVDEALTTLRRIEEPEIQAVTIRTGEWSRQPGDELTREFRSILKTAVDVARRIDGWMYRDDALAEIAVTQFNVGALDDALDTVPGISDRQHRSTNLVTTFAVGLARIGRNDLAIPTLLKVKDRADQVKAIGQMADQPSDDSLRDSPEIRAILTAARQNLGRADEGVCIAEAEAKLGLYEAAIETAFLIDDRNSRAEAIRKISEASARAGDLLGAIETALIEDSNLEAMTAIATAFPESGDVSGIPTVVAEGRFCDHRPRPSTDQQVPTEGDHSDRGDADTGDDFGNGIFEDADAAPDQEAEKATPDSADRSNVEFSSENRDLGLACVAEIYMSRGQDDEALRIVRLTSEDMQRARIPRVSAARLKNGDTAGAIDLIRSGDAGADNSLISAIVKACLKDGDLATAHEFAMMADKKTQKQVLKRAAQEKLDAGDIVGAVEMISRRGKRKANRWIKRRVDDCLDEGRLSTAVELTKYLDPDLDSYDFSYEHMLKKIVSSLVGAADSMAAFDLARALPDEKSRRRVFLGIGQELASAGRLDDAQTVLAHAAEGVSSAGNEDLFAELSVVRARLGHAHDARTTVASMLQASSEIGEETVQKQLQIVLDGLDDTSEHESDHDRETTRQSNEINEALRAALNRKDASRKAVGLVDVAAQQLSAGMFDEAQTTLKKARKAAPAYPDFGTDGMWQAAQNVGGVMGYAMRMAFQAQESSHDRGDFWDEERPKQAAARIQIVRARLLAVTGKQNEARAILSDRSSSDPNLANSVYGSAEVHRQLVAAHIAVGNEHGAHHELEDKYDAELRNDWEERRAWAFLGALLENAKLQTIAGQSEDAQASLQTAVQTICNWSGSDRIDALIRIALAQSELIGSAAESAAETLAIATEMTGEMNSADRADAMRKISRAYSRTGDLQSGRKCSNEAVDLASRIHDRSDREHLLQTIAIDQANAGFGVDALETSERITIRRAEMVPELASALAGRGDSESFIRLIQNAADFLEPDCRYCRDLAQVFPEQRDAIAAVVRNSIHDTID